MVYWNCFIGKLNTITKLATILGFAALFISVIMQIVFRYVLAIPTPWSDELARYLLVWVSLLAISIAFKNDSHIRFDLFIRKCPAFVRHLAWVALNLMTLVFLALLFYYGIPNAILGKFTCSPGLTSCFPRTNITMFLPYLSVPVTAGIMILNLLDYLVSNFRAKEIGDIREKVMR